MFLASYTKTLLCLSTHKPYGVSICPSLCPKFVQKLSSLIKHFHTVIILVSYKELFLVTNAAGGMIQPFWAVVSKLKHRFTIHCKHLNSAVSKLRYNDKTSVTCNTNTYRRHKLSISTSFFAKAFHKVPCLYIQFLYSELITYGLLVTGTFKKQVPELNL